MNPARERPGNSLPPTHQPRRVCLDAYPSIATIDGLLYQSSMAGRVCATLWSPALDSFPPGPAFSKLLADPAEEWMKVLRNAAAEIHYDFYR
jgi:hypothetical protein